MKLNSISFNNFKAQNFKPNKIKNNNNLNQNQNKQTLIIPSTAQFLAFCGGYSVDLAQTFSQLRDEQYPKDIKDMISDVLLDGNIENKTLYDIHFKKYKGILDCYTLNELIEKYPEFKDIKSANNVEATKESFIGKFQNNELELFSKEEDLTLQLIKLYWGQGFSLTDLSNYIAQNDKNNQGINLYYTMKKLNIPMMNNRYALVLKLSNKEYNEKFTSEMSIRTKEAKEAKLQKAQGEAVVIPRGELSEAHKEHISQGLKKYYQQHPEKIYEMSQRQRQFYEQNPQKIEELSKVTLFAWHETKEGASVLKGLKKFFRKSNSEITIEELANPLQISGKKRNLLDAFWQRNTWAKESFSKAMKQGWQHQKEKINSKPQIDMKEIFKTVEGTKIKFNLIPTNMKKDIISWAKAQGYDTSNLIIGDGIIHRRKEDMPTDKLVQNNTAIADEIVEKYLIAHPKVANARVSCLLRAIVKLQKTLKDGKNLPESLQNNPQKTTVMDYQLSFLCSTHDIPTPESVGYATLNREYSALEIEILYTRLMEQAMKLDCWDFGEYMDKLLDKSYTELKAHGKI